MYTLGVKPNILTTLGVLIVLAFAGLVVMMSYVLVNGDEVSSAPSRSAPLLISKDSTFGQAEAHFDFSTAERLAVPCFPGYRCSEIDGRKLPDGRFSWGVIFIEPEARQSVRPPIRRPDNE